MAQPSKIKEIKDLLTQCRAEKYTFQEQALEILKKNSYEYIDYLVSRLKESDTCIQELLSEIRNLKENQNGQYSNTIR